MSQRRLRGLPKDPQQRRVEIGKPAAQSLAELNGTATAALRDLQVAFAVLCRSHGVKDGAKLIGIDGVYMVILEL